jgi:hypothetical protein
VYTQLRTATTSIATRSPDVSTTRLLLATGPVATGQGAWCTPPTLVQTQGKDPVAGKNMVLVARNFTANTSKRLEECIENRTPINGNYSFTTITELFYNNNDSRL